MLNIMYQKTLNSFLTSVVEKIYDVKRRYAENEEFKLGRRQILVHNSRAGFPKLRYNKFGIEHLYIEIYSWDILSIMRVQSENS